MDHPILIRPALPHDASAINFLTEELGYKNTLNETISYLEIIEKDAGHAVFVSTVDDQLIGWIEVVYVTQLESGSFCEIVGLIVNEKYRGLGAGKQLVNSAIKWSGEKSSKKLRVRCNVKRVESHFFYEHIGFAIVKEQKVFELKIM